MTESVLQHLLNSECYASATVTPFPPPRPLPPNTKLMWCPMRDRTSPNFGQVNNIVTGGRGGRRALEQIDAPGHPCFYVNSVAKYFPSTVLSQLAFLLAKHGYVWLRPSHSQTRARKERAANWQTSISNLGTDRSKSPPQETKSCFLALANSAAFKSLSSCARGLCRAKTQYLATPRRAP